MGFAALNPSYSVRRPSLRFDISGLDDRPPLLDLCSLQAGERLRRLLRARRYLRADIAKPGLHRRVSHCLAERRIEPFDHTSGRALRGPQAKPARRVESRQAGLVDARNL